ncbi:MAG: hypothetical protein ACLFU9_02095 [Candidatus Bathyarchaeia archaeon]
MKIEVFVPLGSCVCSFAPIMEKVGRATAEFQDSVEVRMKSTKSPEASKHRIEDTCVLVDEKFRFPAGFDEKKLEDAVLQSLQQRSCCSF